MDSHIPKGRIALLFISAVIGLVLTAVYFSILKECDFWEHSCTPYEKYLHTRILVARVIYLTTTSLFLLGSAFALSRKKSIGIYFFIVATILIFGSILLPENLFLTVYSSSDRVLPFFLSIISSALLGGIFLGFLPTIGAIIFFVGIVLNLISLPLWIRYFAISHKQFIRRIIIMIVIFLTIVLCLKFYKEIVSQKNNGVAVTDQSFIEKYRESNEFFSKPVVIDNYEYYFNGDAGFRIVFSYKNTNFKTYTNVHDNFINDKLPEILESLLGKEVNVVVPPLELFNLNRKKDNSLEFYAKVYNNGIDIQNQLDYLGQMPEQQKLDINLEENKNENLKILQYVKDLNSTGNPGSLIQEYQNGRLKDLCTFFSQPREISTIGFEKNPRDDYYLFYAVFKDLANVHIIFDNGPNIVGSQDKIPTEARLQKFVEWYMAFLQHESLPYRVDFCTEGQKAIQESPYFFQPQKQTLYGPERIIPDIERYNIDIKTYQLGQRRSLAEVGSNFKYLEKYNKSIKSILDGGYFYSKEAYAWQFRKPSIVTRFEFTSCTVDGVVKNYKAIRINDSYLVRFAEYDDLIDWYGKGALDIKAGNDKYKDSIVNVSFPYEKPNSCNTEGSSFLGAVQIVH